MDGSGDGGYATHDALARKPRPAATAAVAPGRAKASDVAQSATVEPRRRATFAPCSAPDHGQPARPSATSASTRWCGCAGSPSSARPPRCWWSISGSTSSCRSGPAWRSSRCRPGSISRCASASRVTQRLEPDRAAWLLAFDIAELAVLLFLTGGLQNPSRSCSWARCCSPPPALPPRMTLLLGGFAITCATVLDLRLTIRCRGSDEPLDLPADLRDGHLALDPARDRLHRSAAWQITEEARQLADALAATELVLAREQHLSQLDGLAAAAAHELGTPLSTITVVAKELERAMKPDSPHAEDVRLLREQAQRCREHPGQAHRAFNGGRTVRPHELSPLIEEVVAPHRNFGIDINVDAAGRPRRPNRSADAIRPSSTDSAISWRTPSTSPANGRGRRAPGRRNISVTITDDGPGFAPEVMDRIGEPYVTSRRNRDSGGTMRADLRLTSTKRSALGWASSSPRRCWNDRVRRSSSGTGLPPNGGRRARAMGSLRVRAEDRIRNMKKS